MITVSFEGDKVTIKRDGAPIACMVAPTPEAFHSLLWFLDIDDRRQGGDREHGP